jgi:putative ABC transport system permease protein
MLANYLKIAWKVMLRRKFFTFVSLFGIAFTMIVVMVAVSLIDHTFGPMAPESRVDRMVGVYRTVMRGPHATMMGGAGYRLLDRYVRRLQPVEAISFHSNFETVYNYQTGKAEPIYEKRTDGAFWQILDFAFVEGASFNELDNHNRSFVAVINKSTREKLFGRGSRAVGRSIDLDGQSFRVVGVVEDVPILRQSSFSDVWVPLTTAKTDTYKAELLGGFMATVLVRKASDVNQLRGQLAALLPGIDLPRDYNSIHAWLDSPFEFASRMIFGRDSNESHPGRLIGALIGSMFLFMLLPTVNLVNVNLSRILERSSEIGVRKAFGASSWVLVGQFVVENVVLTLIGGAIGLLGAELVLRLLTFSALIPYAHFSMNYRIFGYALAIAVFFGVISGVYPAWRMSRMQVVDALRGVSSR